MATRSPPALTLTLALALALALTLTLTLTRYINLLDALNAWQLVRAPSPSSQPEPEP